MNNINCPDPNCVYNENKKKCVQPNPYIQYLSRCKKSKLSKEECDRNYKINKDIIKKQACNNYRYNLTNKDNKSCPPIRRPVNNKCINKDFKILKNNNHGIPCCYKEKKPLKSVLINASNKIKGFIKNKQLRNEFKDKKEAAKKIKDAYKFLKAKKEFQEAKKKYNPFKFVKDDKKINLKTGKIYKKIDRYQHRDIPNKVIS